MTPLRAKYIRDLTVRGRAQRTQRAYTRYVSELALYYQRSPELISYEEVTNWLYHLIKERQVSASSVNVAVNAVRFFYGITLGRILGNKLRPVVGNEPPAVPETFLAPGGPT
jgi:integrase/recombinase XerD